MMKKLAISEVSMFLNLGPILTVFVAGCFIASERARCSDAIKVVLSFIGVLMIVLGKNEALSNAEGVKENFSLWYYAIMAIAPCVIVVLNIIMTSLRNLHQIVLPFYMSTFTWILYGILGLIYKDGFLPT